MTLKGQKGSYMNCETRIMRLKEAGCGGLENRINQLVFRGRTIRAIFVLRAVTGMSLLDTRHYMLTF